MLQLVRTKIGPNPVTRAFVVTGSSAAHDLLDALVSRSRQVNFAT
jgi:hypothetical protein